MAIKLAALAGVVVLACSRAALAGGGDAGGPRLLPPSVLVTPAVFTGPAGFKYLPFVAGGFEGFWLVGGFHGDELPGQASDPGGYHGFQLPGQTQDPGGHKGVWLPGGGIQGPWLSGGGVQGPWLPGGGHTGPWLPGGHKGS